MNLIKKLTEEVRASREEARRPTVRASSVLTDGPPAVRKGEDPMSSRPFRLIKLLGALGRNIRPEQAKIELDLMRRFRKAMDETGSTIEQASANSVLFPVDYSKLPDSVAYSSVARELLEAASAGLSGYDPDEVNYIRKSYLPNYAKAPMSFLNDAVGGTLVAPPEMGEVIPLMRNRSALDRAGAKQYPIPPQGKVVFPRISSATAAYWVAENTEITESQLGTGEVTLMAKKLGVLVRVSNELFKFTSGAAEAIIRDDMAKSLALKIDQAGLYGSGGGEPKGLVQYTDPNELIDYATTTPTPPGVGANGNQVRPEDGYRMASMIEDRNFDVDRSFKWITRPRLWGRIASARADAVTANDNAGPFVQAITRLVGDKVGKEWCGYPVIGSAQVRANQTKGTGTNLTEVWGGVWEELMMGMYGAIEFATNDKGEETFLRDQTIIRAILFADVCPRYPGAFIYYKQCIQ